MSRKNIIIRVDSNYIIASGHLMRCISIAKELRKRGYNILFLISDDNSEKLINENYFEFINLHTSWNDLEKEIPQVWAILSEYNMPIFLIDTYSVTKEYVQAFADICRACYLGSKKEALGDLNILINYSTVIDLDFYKNNYTNTKLLLGPIYAPLREEYRGIKREVSDSVRKVLVTLGNTDQNHLLAPLLKALEPISEDYDFEIYAIVGSMVEDAEDIINNYANSNRIITYRFVSNMAEIMQKVDVAISANGTTVYELVATKTPTITVAIVKEQVESAESFERLMITRYCGRSFEQKQECINKICESLVEMCKDKSSREKMINNAVGILDGEGTTRIVAAFEEI